jgi:hypothetical protein
MQKGRSLPDWITGFLKYKENSESPRSYLMWSACSTIAAALQRKCYMKWDAEIYPNMYVILVGPSGCRKSDGIKLARSLAEKLNIPILGEKNTTEAVIQTMSRATTAQQGTRITMHSSMSCFVEEFSIFMNRDTNSIGPFTNWYDCPNEWRYHTKHQGDDTIVGVYVNVLGATAPQWLPGIFSMEAIRGGFTSRCIFVVEEKKFQTVADPTINKPDKQLFAQLSRDLERIQSMAGEFRFDEDAHREYVEWYEREDKKLSQGKPNLMDENFQGYNTRRGTHVKKLCIVMSTSRSDDYTIRVKDFRRALTSIETAEKKMPLVFAEIGEGRYSSVLSRIKNYIEQYRTVTRSEILNYFERNLDTQSYENIMKMLTNQKVVTKIIDKGEELYRWNPKLTVIEGDKDQ